MATHIKTPCASAALAYFGVTGITWNNRTQLTQTGLIMTANYTDTGIDAEIHDTATLDSLIWLRERVQSHIDALTPTLAETQQTGLVQDVGEAESEAWYWKEESDD